MVKKIHLIFLAVFGLAFMPVLMSAQVLGPCGTPVAGEEVVAAAKSPSSISDLLISPIPLPGQRAIDFELTAVVGNEIKQVKLSDYQGKWRIVCFFPAAFTFV